MSKHFIVSIRSGALVLMMIAVISNVIYIIRLTKEKLSMITFLNIITVINATISNLLSYIALPTTPASRFNLLMS